MVHRSYDQYCPIAAALDVVGDRWTLLIMRELTTGDRRFTDLRAALPGIAPNLLADRLRELQADGLVEQRELPPPAARTVYAATAAGREVVPVLRSLARFGVARLGPPGDDDVVRAADGGLRDALAVPRPRGRPASGSTPGWSSTGGRSTSSPTARGCRCGGAPTRRRTPRSRSRRATSSRPARARDARCRGRPAAPALRPPVPAGLTDPRRYATAADMPSRPATSGLTAGVVEDAEPRLELAQRELLGLVPAGPLVVGRLGLVVPAELLALGRALDGVGDARPQARGHDADEVGAAAGLAQHDAQVQRPGGGVVGQRLGR